MKPEDDEFIEREFDIVMMRSGIVVPEEFRIGALANYRDLRRQAMLIRAERPADAAPSYGFRVDAPGLGR